MIGDDQLLRRYVDEHSEAAFTELVRRHVNLVYHTALRRVGGDRHLAEDVSQGVFADLARKAAALQNRAGLSGWLHTATRFAAAQAVRTARRQRTHALEAHLMQEINGAPAADWTRLRPVIDEALDELSEADREVVLLRFFEARPLAEVGARFALTPDAARMRVDRALEKLHGLLARRGITSTAAALAAAFAGQAGLAAPAGLVARIVAGVAAGQGATAVTIGGIAFAKVLAGAAVVLLGAGMVIYHVAAPPPKPPVGPAATIAAVPAVLPVPPAVAPAQATDHEAATTPAPGPVRPLAGFADLPGSQKNILKRLWAIQQVIPDEGAVHTGFKVSPQVPQFADIEDAVVALQARGLVGVGAQKGVVFLTQKGRAFCAAHPEEIDAYELPSRPD